MDIKAFFNNTIEHIKALFSNLKEKISSSRLGEWVSENKKIALIVSSLILIMIICVILLIVVGSNKKDTKPKYEEELILSNELMIPEGPEIPKDYVYSREKKEKWSKEEADQWYTPPSENDMKGLQKANDILIDNILGAAP